ncbi:hypothetical protein NQ315_001185 [Exocentrus adspersus]|uniref:Uncharacterized protein n=1 Tax=Exocentrus adspersus TaxID=1586481 RepID=A0AAV8WES4_9CUCU|nr:hypothetical protein NQ315_001185 [Exocentrus adspersus]
MNVESIIDLEDVENKCRICLQHSDQMIALNCTYKEENGDAKPLLVSDILESIFFAKLSSDFDASYPEAVCLTCYESATVAYELKATFKKTQYILETFPRDLKLSSLPESENCFTLCEDSNGSQETSDVNNVANKDQSIEEASETKNFMHIHPGVVPFEDNDQNDFFILKVTDDDNQDDIEVNQDAGSGNAKIAPPIKVVAKKTPVRVQKNGRKYMQVLFRCSFCRKYLKNKPSYEQHKQICQTNLRRRSKITTLVQSPKIMPQRWRREKPSTEILMSTVQKLLAKVTPVKQKDEIVTCKICQKVCTNPRNYSYHMLTKHRDKKYFCNVCNKAFSTKLSRDHHLETHTKNECREVCPECGKGFHYRGALFYHMKIHRGERNYMCSYCGHKFLNASGLSNHMLIHTGEKPWKCKICDRSFRSASILKNHERTHTGEKPHACKYCGKRFITSYSCRVHMAGHRGNFPCHLCKWSLIDKEVLKLHLKFKHGKEDEANIEDSE